MGKLAAVKAKDKGDKMEMENKAQVLKVKSKKVRKQKQAVVMQMEEKKRVRKQKRKQTPTPGPQNKSALYKDFTRTLGEAMKVPDKITKGQKERLLKKQKVMKRKLLDKFLQQKKKKQNSATFILDELKSGLKDLDARAQEEQRIRELNKHKGTLPHERERLLHQDAEKMRQIFQIKQFQQNPLATIRMHLENTYRQNAK